MGHAHIRGNDEWDEVWNFDKVANDPNLEGQRPLPAGTNTIGSLLQSVGYKTGMVGKWGLGAPLSDGVPTNREFDFFYGFNCQRQAHTHEYSFMEGADQNKFSLLINDDKSIVSVEVTSKGLKLAVTGTDGTVLDRKLIRSKGD